MILFGKEIIVNVKFIYISVYRLSEEIVNYDKILRSGTSSLTRKLFVRISFDLDELRNCK